MPRRRSLSAGRQKTYYLKRGLIITGSDIAGWRWIGVSEWWSIEVFDAEELPARRWKDSYQDQLIEAALTNGAVYWEWHEHRYGVVFEVLFDSAPAG